ncbi:hypothetical protein HW555_012589 [Spodoptera exigua]|uniref:Uncharacterized protein n=1 Tax=Spodoptera exigua TaxID=7107 RepID=A0A835G6S5_SPOEX|nr:hypothetical protein HW555_012589 [Spodoptera exigua]
MNRFTLSYLQHATPKVVTPRSKRLRQLWRTRVKSRGPTLSEEDVEMISVKCRIPPFWRDTPRLWFAHFETMMSSQNLSEEGKSDSLLRSSIR